MDWRTEQGLHLLLQGPLEVLRGPSLVCCLSHRECKDQAGAVCSWAAGCGCLGLHKASMQGLAASQFSKS